MADADKKPKAPPAIPDEVLPYLLPETGTPDQIEENQAINAAIVQIVQRVNRRKLVSPEEFPSDDEEDFAGYGTPITLPATPTVGQLNPNETLFEGRVIDKELGPPVPTFTFIKRSTRQLWPVEWNREYLDVKSEYHQRQQSRNRWEALKLRNALPYQEDVESDKADLAQQRSLEDAQIKASLSKWLPKTKTVVYTEEALAARGEAMPLPVEILELVRNLAVSTSQIAEAQHATTRSVQNLQATAELQGEQARHDREALQVYQREVALALSQKGIAQPAQLGARPKEPTINTHSFPTLDMTGKDNYEHFVAYLDWQIGRAHV